MAKGSGLLRRAWPLAVLLCALGSAPARADQPADRPCDPTLEDCDPGTLRPTFEPRPAEEPEVYTTRYYFAMTRSVADSTIHPAAQMPLLLLTIPLDLALLPVAAIAGFFPG